MTVGTPKESEGHRLGNVRLKRSRIPDDVGFLFIPTRSMLRLIHFFYQLIVYVLMAFVEFSHVINADLLG